MNAKNMDGTIERLIHLIKQEGESEQGDIEGAELLEQDKDKKDESLISQARIKLPNPFRKSKIDDDSKYTTDYNQSLYNYTKQFLFKMILFQNY